MLAMTAWRPLDRTGATVELEHAASLGLLGEIERMVERDPEILKRPRIMKALIGGAATKESPLQAVRRRGRTEIVTYLLEHGAIDVPAVILA